jgi:hypothetical protein
LNIEQLLSLSGELLADLSAWSDPKLGLERPSLVPIVRKLAGWLPNFKEYFVNSNVSVIRCAALIEKDANVRKFLAKQRARGELLQLLELPILRLVKYPVLLAQLVKQAPSQRYAEQLGTLSRAIEAWVEEQVAQNRTDAIGFEQLTRVGARIDGFDVAVPGRFFVHEGDALVRTGASPSSVTSPAAAATATAKAGHVFLFNDILIVTTAKTFNKKRYDFKQHVLIDAMTEVRAIAGDAGGTHVWFRVQKLDNERAEHDFAVKNNHERVAWLGYLKHIIQQRGGMLTESFEEQAGAAVDAVVAGVSPASGAGSSTSVGASDALSKSQSGADSRSSLTSSATRRHQRRRRGSSPGAGGNEEEEDANARVAHLQIELSRLKRELKTAQHAAEHQRGIALATDELLIDERRLNAERLEALELQLKAERKARRAAEDDRLSTAQEAGVAAIAKLASVSAELESMRLLVDVLLKPPSAKMGNSSSGIGSSSGSLSGSPARAASAPPPTASQQLPPPLPKDE